MNSDLAANFNTANTTNTDVLSVFTQIPTVTAATFVAPTATLIGHVELAIGVSVWYGAVLRGDLATIQVGAFSNIQDGAVLHGDPDQPTIIADYVTIGHRAVVHSAHIERGSLVGIGAIVLNGVRVGAGSMIGAGAVVTKDVPPRSLVVGLPGKVVRPVTAAEADHLIHHAEQYERLAQAHAHRDQPPRE